MTEDETESTEGLVSAAQFVAQFYRGIVNQGSIRTACDHAGIPIPGTLCLDTGKPGPTVVVNAMMHLSEPAGLAAQQNIVDRWQEGNRPSSGKIYLTLGHEPDVVARFLSESIDKLRAGTLNYDDGHFEDMERLDRLGEEIWRQADGRVLDIHSTPNHGDQPMVIPYASIPTSDIWKASSDLAEIAGSIADDGTNLPATAARIAPQLEHMPVKHVVLDYYNFGVVDPRMCHWFGTRWQQEGNIPLVLESGGPNLAMACRSAAVRNAQGWLEHQMAWKKGPSLLPPERHYYSGCSTVYHPSHYDTNGSIFTAAHEADTFYMLHGPDSARRIAEPAHREMVDRAIAQCKPGSQALKNFQHIPANTPVAVGGKTGALIQTPADGYPLFATYRGLSADSKQPPYLLVMAHSRHREKDLLPDLTAKRARGV